MAVDLAVRLTHQPGALAEVGEVLGNAEINIEAIAGFGVDGEGIVHLIVHDAARARRVLEDAGVLVEAAREALIVTLRHEPGSLGAYTRKLAEEGINIEALYLAGEGRDSMKVVLVVEDTETARAIHP